LAIQTGGIQVRTSLGCDVCLKAPRVPFEAEHPAAIEVAMATQEAAERGDLELNPLVHPALTLDRHLPSRLDEISPKHLAKLWSQTRPARHVFGARMTLEFIFVDTDRACRFDVRFGEVIEGDSSNGPADVRLITTKAGFHHLLESDFDDCETQKLIAIDAETNQHRKELRQLFSAAATNIAKLESPNTDHVTRY
jgi:hypothetical protein